MKFVFRPWKILLPTIAALAFWQWGNWAFEHYHCSYYAKSIPPCIAHGYNIQGLLGLSLFWSQLGFYVLLPICVLAMIVGAVRKSRPGS
jgi:hypothetical protein